jgi:RNA polymerase sigma-70 factor, ECF subfamily
MLPHRVESFEAVVLPHMRAGYNLARWLLRNDQDAEDVTQEAIVRAFRFFDGFSGDNPRAWLLTVVRNSAYTFLQQNRARELGTEFDEALHGEPASNGRTSETPEVLVLRSAQQRFLNEAVEALPVEFREVFVLREMEELSYKEIAHVARIPIGTVMSRLSRARRQLQNAVAHGEQAGSAS